MSGKGWEDMKYRKRPVVIEAFRLGIDGMPGWFCNRVVNEEVHISGNSRDGIEADIKTLEGWHHAECGDYIIKGVKDEIYPCKPDIFEMTYEKVEEKL